MVNIIRLTQYELIRTAIMRENTYLFTTDTARLYYDDGYTRKIVPYKFVETELQRIREVIPKTNINYYVWETNELWTYAGVWIIKAGSDLTSPAYYHNKDYTINALDTGYADNNGMLGDGSIIIRDVHKTVKGRMFVDLNTNNLVISSFMGGGLTFLPAGVTDTITHLPDPIFKYKMEGGEYIVDENGNKVIEEVADIPAYNMIDLGRIDYDIVNNYNSDGSIVSKDVVLIISDMLKMTRNYIYDGGTERWEPNGEATLEFQGNIKASGSITDNTSVSIERTIGG